MSDVLDELLAALEMPIVGAAGDTGGPAARRYNGVVGEPRDSEMGGPHVRPDPERERRKGVPEVVYAPGKSPEQAIAAARALLERDGRALLSRVDAELE